MHPENNFNENGILNHFQTSEYLNRFRHILISSNIGLVHIVIIEKIVKSVNQYVPKIKNIRIPCEYEKFNKFHNTRINEDLRLFVFVLF